jgi:hypothetical protein
MEEEITASREWAQTRARWLNALPVDGWETAGGSSSAERVSDVPFHQSANKITDLDCLKQALEDLQYSAERARCGYGLARAMGEADLVADLGDLQYRLS